MLPGMSAVSPTWRKFFAIASSSGTLYGLNASGQQIWSTQVGAAIEGPDEQNATLTTGLGAGDGPITISFAIGGARLLVLLDSAAPNHQWLALIPSEPGA